MTTEMNYLEAAVSKLERLTNKHIRNEIKVDQNISEDIERQQLTLFGHISIPENRWPNDA